MFPVSSFQDSLDCLTSSYSSYLGSVFLDVMKETYEDSLSAAPGFGLFSVTLEDLPGYSSFDVVVSAFPESSPSLPLFPGKIFFFSTSPPRLFFACWTSVCPSPAVYTFVSSTALCAILCPLRYIIRPIWGRSLLIVPFPLV